MDYHSLKRKELQALCKEHNIPANSSNTILADKLSALLNEKQKPITRQRTCMKSSIEATEEGEPAALKRQAKKVRFSPSNELVEYELRSGEKQKDIVTGIKTRRKSVVNKADKPVDGNNTPAELVDDDAQMPVRRTRSRVQLSGKDVVIPNNEKKPSRRGAKVVEKGTDVDKETESNVGKVTRSKAHTLNKGGDVQREENKQSKRLRKDVEKVSEIVKEIVVSPARVTRSKAHTLMEGDTVPDVNPHVKKKRDKQVETDGKDVEPSKDIMDVPVRATRSRRQALKEDAGNMVVNPQADKKRTRREMKATDLRSNSTHVAPVDEQEAPKRKSLRTRGMETMDEDEGDKSEVAGAIRVTRSKAPLAMEVSGRNSRNKANKVEPEQLEEPSKHAGKKNISRRKSVLQPEKTEVVLPIEEPLNRAARKNTRRKSVMQKASKMVELPTVGKNQSKVQSGKLSMIDEGLDDKRNVIRSGKDASENEVKEVTSGSPKSRKRRENPIIEDHMIETGYGSPVDKSPKRSTRSASKSERKSAVKEQPESSLKKPVSRMNTQLSVENASKGKSRALRSGAIIGESSSKKIAKQSGGEPSDSEDHDVNLSKEGTRIAKLGNVNLDEVTEPEVTPAIDSSYKRFTRSTIKSGSIIRESSSKKKAKLSGVKPSDSEDHDGNTSKEGTPVAKFGNFNLDEVTEPEVTPAIGKSDKRLTRSTIKSGIKEPSQSAFKEQRFTRSTIRPDPDINTAPGRITRRGIQHGGSAAGRFSEKVGKKQASQSAHKTHLADDQTASPKVADVRPDLDVATTGVQSESKKLLDDVQMSSPEVADAQLLSPKLANFRPDPAVNTAPGRITRSGIKHGGSAAGRFSEKVGKKKQASQSAHKKQPLDDDQMASPIVAEVESTPDFATTGVQSELKEPVDEVQMSSPEVAEGGPNTGIETIGVRSEIKQHDDDVQMCSVELAEVRSSSDSDILGIETEFSKVKGQVLGDLSASESVRLPNKVMEENTISESGTSVDMGSVSLVPEEKASGEVFQDASAFIEKSTYEASATPCLTENLLSGKQPNHLELQNFDNESPLGKNPSRIKGTPASISDGSHVQNQNEEVYVESGIFDNATLETSILKSGILDAKEKEMELIESGSASKGPQTDVIEEPRVSVGKVVVVEEGVVDTKGNMGDADNNCDPVSFDVDASAVRPDAKEKEMELTESGSASKGLQTDVIEEPLVPVGKVVVMEESAVATNGDSGNANSNFDPSSFDVGASPVCHSPIEQPDIESKHMPSAKGGKLGGSSSVQFPSVDYHDDGDGGEQYVEEESAGAQKPLVSEPDSEDRGVAVGVDVQEHPFSGNDIFGDSDNAISHRKSPLDKFDTHVIGQGIVLGDGINVPKESETGSERSNAGKTLEVPVSGSDIDIDCVIEDNVQENSSKTLDVSVSGNDIDIEDVLEDKVQDGESEHDQLTSNDNPAMIEEDVGGDDLEPARNEFEPVVAEVLVQSCHQEPGQVLNVSADDVPCDTAGQSDSITSKDTQKTPATSELDDMDVGVDALEESALDINKDVVSSILGDTDDMDAGDDDEQRLTEAEEGVHPQRGENISPDMSNEQIKEEGETSRGNIHTLDNQEHATTDNLDSGNGKILEGGSHISADKVDSGLAGDIHANEDLTREEASPTSKEDDGNEQEESRNVGGSVDWGDYDLGMDDFEEPFSPNRSDVGKDNQDSDLHTSGRTSISIGDCSGLAAGLANSVRNLEKDSRNVDDGKSKQDLDDADMTEQGFNLSGSLLKPGCKTPVVTQISHVNDDQEDAVSFANQDPYSSLKPLFAMPATTQSSHVKEGQQYATSFANKEHYPSLKSLFETPAISRSPVTDSKADAVSSVNITIQYGSCNEDMGTSGTATHEFNHQWENDKRSKAYDGETETQGNAARGQENEMYGVSSFEDDHLKLFGEDDQVDQIKQFEFISEPAGTSHHDFSGLKEDGSINNHDLKNKVESATKGSETDDDLALETGK